MNPPANWYPDPTGRHGQRYWDGEQWTEHVFTDGVQEVDPLDQAAPAEPTGDGAVVDAEAAADVATDDAATDGSAAAHETADLVSDDDARADDASADVYADSPAGGSPAGGANGLFEDANGRDAWSPQDADEDATAVAADMEAEDVVASLTEVGDAPSPTDAPVEEQADAPAVGGDMSDAFVLAPETASRIVKRRGADVESMEAPEAAAAPPAADQDEVADEPVETPSMPPPAAEAAAPTSVVPPSADAPPAAVSTPAADDGELGISGDLVEGDFAERSAAGPVALQNTRLLRCAVTPGDAVVARQGTMVAYQGDVSFDRQGAGGVTRALKRAATGEGLSMMRVEGSGDVFLADGAQHVFILELAGGPGLSVNGRNVLAFSAALAWDIERIKGATLLAGGLFNTTFTGTGWVALVSDGEPVVLHTDEAATHVDVNALVAWSAGLSTRIVSSVSAKSLVGLGSGEAFQMAFEGSGIVIVQPSEGPLGGAAAS